MRILQKTISATSTQKQKGQILLESILTLACLATLLTGLLQMNNAWEKKIYVILEHRNNEIKKIKQEPSLASTKYDFARRLIGLE